MSFRHAVSCSFRRTIQNQPLTKSVLNSRSRKAWRQTGQERELQFAVGVSQCGGLYENLVVIGFLRELGIQRRMFDTVGLAEGVRLGSKSGIEKLSEFGSEKFRISFAHQVQVSENLCFLSVISPPSARAVLGGRRTSGASHEV